MAANLGDRTYSLAGCSGTVCLIAPQHIQYLVHRQRLLSQKDGLAPKDWFVMKRLHLAPHCKHSYRSTLPPVCLSRWSAFRPECGDSFADLPASFLHGAQSIMCHSAHHAATSSGM